MSAQTDIFSKEKRSEVMRAVKSANTKPEIAVRKALHALGLRYRLHGPTVFQAGPDAPARYLLFLV